MSNKQDDEDYMYDANTELEQAKQDAEENATEVKYANFRIITSSFPHEDDITDKDFRAFKKKLFG